MDKTTAGICCHEGYIILIYIAILYAEVPINVKIRDSC